MKRARVEPLKKTRALNHSKGTRVIIYARNSYTAHTHYTYMRKRNNNNNSNNERICRGGVVVFIVWIGQNGLGGQ